MPTAHPDFTRFYSVLGNAAVFVPWQGNVLRQSAPRYQSLPYRFTGTGSLQAGGRWNVQGLMPTIYASADPATLAAEVNQRWARYGWTPAQHRAQLIVGMRWELQAVVDLTARATLRALGVTTTRLTGCNWEAEQNAGREALTQAIARAAFEWRAEGLVVPSARHRRGINLVYFPTHHRDGTQILTPDEANVPFVHGL